MGSMTRKTLVILLPILIGCDALSGRRDSRGTFETTGATSQDSLQVLERPLHLPVSRKGLCREWLKSDFPNRFKSVALKNREELSSSLCVHMVSAFGPEIFYRNSDGIDEPILDFLLNQERAIEVFGHPTLFESAYGIRPYARQEAQRGSQAHHDQLLCCLAQARVSPDYLCKVNGRDRRVADLLADSEADFYISKKELAFTAIAYAHLLPPRCSWKNKFDEEVSFSSVVEELLSRDIGDSHCFGTHLFEAMIVIYRVDREHCSILEKASQKRLEERIGELAATAVLRQKTDGSWGSRWFQSEPHQDDNNEGLAFSHRSKLLVTGHLIQMLAKLPPSFEIEDYVFERGLRWLDMATSELGEEEVTSEFCPCSHAAWCLSHFGTFQEPSDRASVKEGSL